MKIQEILTEAFIDSDLIDILEAKGYKYLDRGVDQMVFLEPGTGLILKIFGTRRAGRGLGLTDAQKTFKTFYDLSKADPNNEFLPNIIEYAPFMFKGRPYLQIRMERLFKFTGEQVGDWKHVLSYMAYAIERNKSFADYWDDASKPGPKQPTTYEQLVAQRSRDVQQQVIMHLGEEGLHKLWDTVVMLEKIAKKNNYKFDLHQGNFMLTSDGDPVITDPFFIGYS